MPEPVIDRGEDGVIFTWFYGNQKNYTLRAKIADSRADIHYINSGRRAKRPLESGVWRPPEYYSRDIKRYGSNLNMVEICFTGSAAPLKGARNSFVPSFVQQISSDLPNVTVIGYSGGNVNAYPDTLARALSDQGRVFGDRTERLGHLESGNRVVVTRFRNGQWLDGGGADARQFQPYHVRVAEARARSARAGTSSMPSGAPHASGARAGGLDAGAEGRGGEFLEPAFL